jgi:signal transduction histidine kinase
MPDKSANQLFAKLPFRIILPAAMTVVLFVLPLFFLILPHFEAKLTENKRQMIFELTNSAWSALHVFYLKEQSGLLDRSRAQAEAVDHIRRLRYGSEQKDYFWINDFTPTIVMHPYRPDLEGKDAADFTDPSGKRLFVACVRAVKEKGAGYVDYQWQWKDDFRRIVPKISYVKGFEPWGWIIGTGIYVEDVKEEIAAITRRITWMCVGIVILMMGLSAYIIWQGARIENQKKAAEKKARRQQAQLFQSAKLASLGTLVSGVAHEINNPTTAIMLNVPVFKKLWQAITPIVDDYWRDNDDFRVGQMTYAQVRERVPLLINHIEDATYRVKNIVSDLKDFARPAVTEMSDQIDLNLVVKKAVGLVFNMIKKSTHHFTVDYQENLPVFTGNLQRIEQVLINLLINACQALPDSSRALAVATGANLKIGLVWVTIEDEGVGIDPAILERITDPFFTTKRESGGTGLGLAISDKIVRDHKGNLFFESRVGVGTTVRMSFPVQL